MSKQDRYLQTFDSLFTPAKEALAEIVGGSLTSRQLHAANGLLHALADEAASARVQTRR
jgi:hypothetical protein